MCEAPHHVSNDFVMKQFEDSIKVEHMRLHLLPAPKQVMAKYGKWRCISPAGNMKFEKRI